MSPAANKSNTITEIKVTPEMVQIGVKVLDESGRFEENGGAIGLEYSVELLYRKMRLAEIENSKRP